MIPTLSWTAVAVVALVVLVAGTINGVAGFGFAVVGTMALATVVDPATAVVFMIVPILAVNISLVRELSHEQLRSCSRRFWPLIAGTLIGTVVGMSVLERVPEAPLRLGLGLLTLGFVSTAQRRFPLPDWLAIGDSDIGTSRLGMIGVGGVSGVLFGGTNVGVQLIAYLRSFDLAHGLFVGVVALIFLGLNGIRIGVASAIGLYPSTAIVLGSVLAAIPATVGVAIGKRLRAAVGERYRRLVVLGLLTIIGIRLVTRGLGVA